MGKSINLRLSDGLHGELKEAAGEDRRSLNSEIVALLDAALTARQAQLRRARQREARDSTAPAEGVQK